jgi:hypothetical protein
MIPSSGLLVSNEVILFQPDHFSIHNFGVLQADVELIGWLPQAPDVDPIENVWIEVKKTIQETLNVLLLKNRMLWMKLLCLSTMFVTYWGLCCDEHNV